MPARYDFEQEVHEDAAKHYACGRKLRQRGTPILEGSIPVDVGQVCRCHCIETIARSPQFTTSILIPRKGISHSTYAKNSLSGRRMCMGERGYGMAERAAREIKVYLIINH